MDPFRIDVRSASHAYPVLIAPGLISQLAEVLEQSGLDRQRFIVSSPLVWRLHGDAIVDALPDVKTILVPDGERFKHLQTVIRIYDGLLKAEADRAAIVIALGGGMIGDTAGFAAATYLRGVALVHVPTTLLAQVDSAVGGKVGVNHPLGKNLIGAFYPPSLVLVDPLLLRTLPRREFRAGLYEVVKYGMVASRGLFEGVRQQRGALFNRDQSVLGPLIAECCRIKAALVAADERESGPRRVLNFGHTVGHALEAVTRYRRFKHGEAVAYGMLAAAEVSVRRRVLSKPDRRALADAITEMGPLPPIGDLSVGDVLEAVTRDKKTVDGSLHFVIPTGIGSTNVVTDVSEKELGVALHSLGMRSAVSQSHTP